MGRFVASIGSAFSVRNHRNAQRTCFVWGKAACSLRPLAGVRFFVVAIAWQRVPSASRLSRWVCQGGGYRAAASCSRKAWSCHADCAPGVLPRSFAVLSGRTTGGGSNTCVSVVTARCPSPSCVSRNARPCRVCKNTGPDGVRGPSGSAHGQQRSRTPAARPGRGAEEFLRFGRALERTFGGHVVLVVSNASGVGNRPRQMVDRVPVGLCQSARATATSPAALLALEHDQPGA